MRSKPLILLALLLAAFLVNLDTTLVNVALPALTRQLQATTTQLQWVVDAYNLVFAALLLTFGSLSDRLGRKGMLLAGLGVVGAASLAGGFTTTAAELIAARAVMGLGAAMTFPATLSLLTSVFTERAERARAIGAWGAVAGVAIALGPIVGGWLLGHFSWGSVFVAMAPVAAVALAGAALVVPTVQGIQDGQGRRRRPGAVVGDDGAARLHRHRGAAVRVDRAPQPGRVRRVRGCCWPRSSPWNGGPRSRCSTCGSSATRGSVRPAPRSPCRFSPCSASSS